MLSPAELARYNEAPTAAFLEGRVLLRELASDLTGVSPAKVIITAVCPDCGGPHGRPQLVGAPFYLSLSRCADAVVAVASDLPIGVDVEPRDGSAARVEAIEQLTGQASIGHWTAVEAVLKADGRGLRVDPREVEVHGTSAQLGDAHYRLIEPELAPDLRVSIAIAVAKR
jgi:4'-phosphopantetheinyl transferase